MKRPRGNLVRRFAKFADDMVSVISPRRALIRQQYRAASAFAYEGASTHRINGPWGTLEGSADADILNDLPNLRARSRELHRDDPTAASIMQTIVDNTVGKAIRAQSRPDLETLGIEPADARDFVFAAERTFSRWCLRVDVQGKLDFLALQRLALRQILENGEAFLVRNTRPIGPSREFSHCWDVVEADRIESPNNVDRLQTDKNQIRSGIEIRKDGTPVAYWVRVGHPGDGKYDNFKSKRSRWRRIPAFDLDGRPNVLHIFETIRPFQTRGVPLFAPVLTKLANFNRFEEAAIVRERIAACFAAFVRTDGDLAQAALKSSKRTNASGQREEELEPGIIKYLAPGQSVEFGNPSGLGQQYEPFVARNLRQIGAAIGLPYELVSKDFSKSNFSNARAAFLEARRLFVRYQQMIIAKLCRPSWNLVLEESELRGFIPQVGMMDQFSSWSKSHWVAPGWGWVQPEKDIAASEKAIAVGVSTLSDEAAEQGRDWEEILEQQARENQRRRELGLAEVTLETTDAETVEEEESEADED